MAGRGDRFRHLRAPTTGDLFEHFGVPTQSPPASDPAASPAPVVSAAACADCGWYRPLPMRGACPLCGAPGRASSQTAASEDPPSRPTQ